MTQRNLQSVIERSFEPPIRWITLHNADSQPIPPFGCCGILGINDDGSFEVARPTADGQIEVLFNGSGPIDPGGYGIGSMDYPATAAYQQGDGSFPDPMNGEMWGPQADNWLLVQGNAGFLIIGDGAFGLCVVMPTQVSPDGLTGTVTDYVTVCNTAGQLEVLAIDKQYEGGDLVSVGDPYFSHNLDCVLSESGFTGTDTTYRSICTSAGVEEVYGTDKTYEFGRLKTVGAEYLAYILDCGYTGTVTYYVTLCGTNGLELWGYDISYESGKLESVGSEYHVQDLTCSSGGEIPTETWAMSNLGATYTILTDNNYESPGVSVNLPESGTYDLTVVLECSGQCSFTGLVLGATIMARLYDTTNSVVVGNSTYTALFIDHTVGGAVWQQTVTIRTFYSPAGPCTVELQVERTAGTGATWGSAQITGSTTLMFVQLSEFRTSQNT